MLISSATILSLSEDEDFECAFGDGNRRFQKNVLSNCPTRFDLHCRGVDRSSASISGVSLVAPEVYSTGKSSEPAPKMDKDNVVNRNRVFEETLKKERKAFYLRFVILI
jgi:hypothetical protein